MLSSSVSGWLMILSSLSKIKPWPLYCIQVWKGQRGTSWFSRPLCCFYSPACSVSFRGSGVTPWSFQVRTLCFSHSHHFSFEFECVMDFYYSCINFNLSHYIFFVSHYFKIMPFKYFKKYLPGHRPQLFCCWSLCSKLLLKKIALSVRLSRKFSMTFFNSVKIKNHCNVFPTVWMTINTEAAR